MLKHLLVKNYAIIDNLEIDFHSGLNIITGETGAGKSILLGALGLILGNRAEVNILKDKENSCVVEGTFNLEGYGLEPLFAENDIDFQPNTVIRRHINPSGKSRAFVNELPVNLNLLKDIVGRVIDIHSQHQSLLLGNAGFQLSVIDSFVGNGNLLDEYKTHYTRFRELTTQLEELMQRAQQAKTDLDYLQFQLNQLEEMNLVEAEEQELEQLQQQLTHSEDIQLALQEVVNYCNAEDISVLMWLKGMEDALKRIVPFYPLAEQLGSRVEAVRIELKDIAQEAEVESQKINHNPVELERVNRRLDDLNTLMQKHRVSSTLELVVIRNELRGKVDEIENYDAVLIKKGNELKAVEQKARDLAQSISKSRLEASPHIEKSIISTLSQLGMPSAGFRVDLTQTPDLTPNGVDRALFLFSANSQIPLQELSRVASGGELSRLMLSLKSLMVKAKGLPTIILDEIDTGVSGEIADKVGNIIQQMSAEIQVINITHLPQIASKGKTHFLVYKEESSGVPSTQIRLLNHEERIEEIAKMLSGEQVSQAAMTNAKHLLAGSN